LNFALCCALSWQIVLFRENSVQVFDKLGKVQAMGDEIARGGEGAVYSLAAKPSVVVKLYHPELLERRGEQMRQKVDAMAGLRAHFDTSALAWPALSVFDQKRNKPRPSGRGQERGQQGCPIGG
jgi:DNA-binding helix-hairpin-helix protein with protein kinase domain